ncbi:hypothetical protein DFP91_0577 [Pseudorhodoplanes sinuspersici]|nr:hypothetical protein DFP91_0577 [Pseudorhodoplanes sinuspersici]
MGPMVRRILTLFIALSIALAGYAPAFAMPADMNAVAAAQPAPPTADETADSDCMKAMKAAADDCCGKPDQPDKSKCLFDDACAARCHVNAAVEFTPYPAFVHRAASLPLRLAPPPPPHAERPGPIYRPPIV